MMINRTIPRLKFKRFTDKWNLTKVKSLIHIKSGKSQKKVKSSNGGYPVIATGGVISKAIKPIFSGPSIVIGRKGTINQPQYISTPFWATDTTFYTTDSNSDVYFIYCLFNTINWLRYNTSTSLPSLTSSTINNIQVNVPSLPEQHKIGTFFATLDHLIQMQQKKVTLLKILKKAYLQKLFPCKGENMPRMRFKGFQNKWDEITINKLIVKGKSGGTPSKNNNNYYGGDIPFLSINDVTSSSGHINKTTKSITSLGLNNSSAWIIPKGSLILSMYASVGEVAENNINLATSQAFFNMIYKSPITTEMMYYVFQYIKLIHGWRPFINTGTQGNLNAHAIRQFIIKLPSLKEQQYISTFLKDLDINIHMQINVLNNLSRLKTAYLQKMFC